MLNTNAAIFTILLANHLALSQLPPVNQPCEESTSCGTGGYCAGNKRCACLSSYVDINGYCWRRINPGEAGCTKDRQCAAVWPGAHCSGGTCRCANNQPPFPTKDGMVCVNYGGCPIGAERTKLRWSDGKSLELPPDCYNFDNMFCCPSRALACIQPQDAGSFSANGGGTITRYYHNTVTGECTQFAYRGSGGNANNFETREHCESYCLQACERGRPLYSGTPSAELSTPTSGLSLRGAQTCDTNSLCGSAAGFHCTAVGTKSLCCPSVESVCSENGAADYNDFFGRQDGLGYDVGIAPGPESQTYSRFYYDKGSARCRPFTYLGQAGNFNNFMSETDCELYCSRTVCTAGLPLKDSSGVRNVNCGGNSNRCPSTHQCKGNLCCPRPQFVCKLAQAPGNCNSYTSRWWFNAATGNCESFTFSGCQGNANNFDKYGKCQDFCKDARVEPRCVHGNPLKDTGGHYVICAGSTGEIRSCPPNFYCHFDGTTYGCCPTQAHTCSLSSNEGRECGPKVTRWQFDSISQRCVTFQYKGCDGNSNNFATQQDCKEYCGVETCPDGGDFYRDRSGAEKICKTDENCPATHKCTTVATASTFRGSVTQNTATRRCCPSKTHVCSLHKDTGTKCATISVPRYFFNQATKTCEGFEYGGCSGNRNNFSTKSACQNYCLSAVCPTGTIVATDIDTERIHTCQSPGKVGQASGGCDANFMCYSSQLLGQNVCCGVPKKFQGSCPSEAQPFISAVTLQAKQCTPNILGSCPHDYFCWYSANSVTDAYYCCTEEQNGGARFGASVSAPMREQICPPQLEPLQKEAALNTEDLYVHCSPTSSAACGEGGFCQFSNSLGDFVCCVPERDICPPIPVGLVPVYSGNGYTVCEPTATLGAPSACPPKSVCLYVGTANAEYICCQKEYELNSRKAEQSHIGGNSTSQNDSALCSNLPDLVPMAPYPVRCSPFAPDACKQNRPAAKGAACVHSEKIDAFVCCELR